MSTLDKDLNEYSARLATFHHPHHLNKRRASNQTTKKKNHAGTVEWPHQFPSPEGLARAGFFYQPAHDSEDNVQCFTCNVKLDGWEPADDPISEHLAHSHGCAWATAISVIRDEDSQQPPEQRDPLSEAMTTARHATFTSADGWPHEGKKGWKCQITKMIQAGWAWDPNDESEDRDGVTCFYCNLSLDGWEPKDDPFVEHQRREPACPFFSLLEHYHGVEVAEGKTKKGKARGKASARTSTASKVSRMSVQSTMSEVPSMGATIADLGIDGSLAGVDDSVVTTATTTSQTTTTGTGKGRKKAVKANVTAKGAKGKKKTAVEEDVMEVNYPEISQPVEEEEDEIAIAPPKATRKAAKTASKQFDSSVVEISQMDVAPKKATRGRKPKVQPLPEPEQEQEQEESPQTPDKEANAEKRMSEISAQLQDELDHTVDDYPLDQSTPVVEPPKPKRGVKRTSDGKRKQQSSDSSAFEVDVPVLSKAQPAEKAKRGRKPKQTSNASTDVEQENHIPEIMQIDVDVDEIVESVPEPAAKKTRGRPKGKKNSSARSSQATSTATLEPVEAPPDELGLHQSEPRVVVKKGRGRPKGSKNSSARSSQLSQASVIVVEAAPSQQADEDLQQEMMGAQPSWPHLQQENPEDIARDEMEIETELERIASEQASHQAVEMEQNQTGEYETSPSQGRLSKDGAEIQQLEQEIQKEKENDSPPRLSLGLGGKEDAFSFSPSGSDKENQPSSIPRQQSSSEDEKNGKQRSVFMSPTKVTRVPLAPGTPNRSPTRTSPSKAQISHLTSTTPWNPVDLDIALLGSDAETHTPGRIAQALVDSTRGVLTERERGMSVEEWVRWRAEQVEEELRRRCEGMVAVFEKEGLRGLKCLEGVDVVG